MISPTGYVDPLLDALFYIFLPAVLALPYVIYEAGAEVINARMKRIGSSEDTSD